MTLVRKRDWEGIELGRGGWGRGVGSAGLLFGPSVFWARSGARWGKPTTLCALEVCRFLRIYSGDRSHLN